MPIGCNSDAVQQWHPWPKQSTPQPVHVYKRQLCVSSTPLLPVEACFASITQFGAALVVGRIVTVHAGMPCKNLFVLLLSCPAQALGSYSHINAYVTPSNICAAVQRVLAMPVEQRRQLGLQARQQYLQDKAQFVQKLRVLRKTLHRWRMEGRYKPSGQSSAEDQ